MNGNVIYLENYVESTAALPSELLRALNTIKELDVRTNELRARTRELVAECVTKPAQHMLKGKANLDAYNEVVQMRKQIDDSHRLLLQWADEKQSLVTIASNMLEEHIFRVEQDKHMLAQELEVEPALDLDESFLGDLPGMMSLSEEKVLPQPLPSRIRDLGEREVKQEARTFAGLDLGPKRLGSQASLQPMVPNAAWDQGAGRGRSGAMAAVGLAAGAIPVAAAQDPELKRQQQLASLNIAQHIAPHGFGKGENRALDRKPSQPGGTLTKRPSGVPDVKVSRAPSGEMGGALGLNLRPAEMLAVPVQIPYIPQIPPGLNTSAQAPQAPGRLLTLEDISVNLQGRMAELYWPDDNLWYLIEIQSVDLTNHNAQIMYVTGETENLDLNEIVREGHMSLMEARRNNSII